MKTILTTLCIAYLLLGFQSVALAQKTGANPSNKHELSLNQRHDRSNYYQLKVRNQDYFYRNGLFYRNHRDRYIVIDPPLGAKVRYLPDSAVSVLIGPNRYFRVGLTWYLFDRNREEYEVVNAPAGQLEDRPGEIQRRPDLVFYPAGGQAQEQTDKDRYECYRWAKNQSGYDPTLPDQEVASKDMYDRAMSACMETRGYTVR